MASRLLILTIEIGGHEIEVHGHASPGDPGQTSGPPENCYPPEPAEFEPEKVMLVVPVTDDLTPNPRSIRPVHLDITDLVEELGGNDIVNQLVEEEFARWESDGGWEDE